MDNENTTTDIITEEFEDLTLFDEKSDAQKEREKIEKDLIQRQDELQIELESQIEGKTQKIDEKSYLRKRIEEKDRHIAELNKEIKYIKTTEIHKLNNKLDSNEEAINRFSERIESLESTIRELNDLLQPRALSKLEKQRILSDFFREEN